MNFARVIGTVVATAKDASVHGVILRILQPEDENGRPHGAPVVAVDPLATREGDRVFFVRAREAAKALPGKFAPVDAAIVGLVDGIDLRGNET
jgi:ethanolamine utilization protein EutN